jgi:ferrous iron transport protein B
MQLGRPLVIALSMQDVAVRNGLYVDDRKLAAELSVVVVPVQISKGEGISELKLALLRAAQSKPKTTGPIDTGLERVMQQTSLELPGSATPQAIDTQARYEWADKVVEATSSRSSIKKNIILDRFDRLSSHPFWGLVLFFVVMVVMFQAVFSWATPIMDMIEATIGMTGDWLAQRLPSGALTSLLVDGVIAGVGAVVIFLPQILILFAFIILLEDVGYMARAAFLMDRFMRACGLSGKSFIPLLSSFACAVPGIMATRVIPDRKDRIATIMAAPFMTCSARLPVYALLIAAFVPNLTVAGYFNLQGLVLFSLYVLGILGGVTTAWIMKRFVLKGQTPSFLMELPPYRMPNLQSLLIKMMERVKIFLRRAGTIIFMVAIVVWSLAYFPHSNSIEEKYEQSIIQAESEFRNADLEERLQQLNNERAAEHLENSYLGSIGKSIEPIFRPLGWDWKISAAVVASFPAREVVIAVLGTIYAVGSNVDETDRNLIKSIKSSKSHDGNLIFSVPVALGIMIFYAFCLQCVATIATMRRETNSWRWPIAAWLYMTGLGYLAALLVTRVGMMW